MRKLFKHLKPYAATIAAIVVILIVQAYCDLSLPSYTSDIVNVESSREELMRRFRMQSQRKR